MLKDVPVKLRDGVTIYTDIYLPVTDEKVPTLIAWRVMEQSLAIKNYLIYLKYDYDLIEWISAQP